MVYIVMGVSGSGKTLIGRKLAEELGLPFYDGDDLHPQSNIEKMRSGEPLDDTDRKPWLTLLANNIARWCRMEGAVLACSALKEKYRDLLRSEAPNQTQFIYLKGSRELIAERMEGRDHFMPEDLLDSQFKALEEPGEDEAVTVRIDRKPGRIVRDILDQLETEEQA